MSGIAYHKLFQTIAAMVDCCNHCRKPNRSNLLHSPGRQFLEAPIYLAWYNIFRYSNIYGGTKLTPWVMFYSIRLLKINGLFLVQKFPKLNACARRENKKEKTKTTLFLPESEENEHARRIRSRLFILSGQRLWLKFCQILEYLQWLAFSPTCQFGATVQNISINLCITHWIY